MKTLSKFTISAFLILYSFIGFTILSPLISILTGNPIFIMVGYWFSLPFFLVTFIPSFIITIEWKGIFSRLTDDEVAKTWLLLHSFFTFIFNQIYFPVAIISSVIPLFSATYVKSFAINFMVTWMISLFSIIGLWSLNKIIGMGYRWFCKGTALGIRSFSIFALQRLRNKEHKGILYLLKALLLLKDCLKYEELELQELNDTIKATKCLQIFQSEIPYDSLQMLALELKRYPSMEHLPQALSAFSRSSKVQWTSSFALTGRTKRTVVQLIVVIAAILSGLTFLPETTRRTLFEVLQSVGTRENMQVFMGVLLLVVIAYISSLTGAYYLNPFEVKKFTLSEAK